jgi:beta-lactamase superfamily II metal-dependent hydrolase
MHSQAKDAFARRQIPWYRTDQNGTIIIRSAAVAFN